MTRPVSTQPDLAPGTTHLVMDADMSIYRGTRTSQHVQLPCTLVLAVPDDFWAAYRPALAADERRATTRWVVQCADRGAPAVWPEFTDDAPPTLFAEGPA